jgi:hypothetical protein
MANFGNWFDSLFKKPWLNLVNEGESAITAETQALITDAEAKIESARAAAAQALEAHQAAEAAVITPIVNTGIQAVAEKIPVIGAILGGQAQKAADAGTVAVIRGITTALENLIDPSFNEPPM